MLSLWAIAVARPSAITSLPSLSHAEIRRYSRHLILDDVGVEGQRRLKAARVLCVGSGGLGSPALVYLAAAGVGTLGVVDNDVVDESNLQRQIIHATDAVGSPKVDSAAQRVGDLNPLVKLVKHEELLTAENALRILGEYDIVVDGSDNFPTRYLVNDACVLLGLPLVYGTHVCLPQLRTYRGNAAAPVLTTAHPLAPRSNMRGTQANQTSGLTETGSAVSTTSLGSA